MAVINVRARPFNIIDMCNLTSYT